MYELSARKLIQLLHATVAVSESVVRLEFATEVAGTFIHAAVSASNSGHGNQCGGRSRAARPPTVNQRRGARLTFGTPADVCRRRQWAPVAPVAPETPT